MHENLYAVLGEMAAVLLFLTALSLFFYVGRARVGILSAFEAAYQRDSVVSEKKGTASPDGAVEAAAEWIGGDELVLMMEATSCPVSIDGTAFEAGVQDMERVWAAIDEDSRYDPSRLWGEQGQLVAVSYMKQ